MGTTIFNNQTEIKSEYVQLNMFANQFGGGVRSQLREGSPGWGELYFDNQNLQAKVKINRTSYFDLTTSGASCQFYNISYSDTYWDDLTMTATQLRQGALAKPVFDYVNNGLQFIDDASEKVFVTDQTRHKMKEGSEICPHVHFIQTSSSVPRFVLNYRTYSNGSTVGSFASVSSQTTLVYTYTTGSMLNIAEFTTLTPASGLSAIFDFQLWRAGDTAPTTVLVKAFDLHYEIDQPGSSGEYTK